MDTQTCELVSQKCPTEGIGSGDILRKYLFLLVRPAGIEPATNGLEGGHPTTNGNTRQLLGQRKQQVRATQLFPLIVNNCPYLPLSVPKVSQE